MHLHKGYGVKEVTRNSHQILLPPHTPPLPTNLPNLPPHHFPFFSQLDQHPHTPTIDSGDLIGLLGAGGGSGGGGFTSYRPPPSVVVAPQPPRWINQEDPLWKCVHKSESQMDTHYSQSPGSVSEIYESTPLSIQDNGVIKDEKKKKKKKKHPERELKLMACFIEKQLTAHQERLHQRFTEAIEKMERERREREESWRASDAQAARLQAATRAEERALASSREAVIVSYLERINKDFNKVKEDGNVDDKRLNSESS